MSISMLIPKPILTVQNCHMLIPHAPDVLVLPVVTYWDGTPCANTRLHGVVTLGAEEDGLSGDDARAAIRPAIGVH